MRAKQVTANSNANEDGFTPLLPAFGIGIRSCRLLSTPLDTRLHRIRLSFHIGSLSSPISFAIEKSNSARLIFVLPLNSQKVILNLAHLFVVHNNDKTIMDIPAAGGGFDFMSW